jgi:hypothetical protein
MKKFIVLTVCFLLIACGGSSGGGTDNKDLFSLWLLDGSEGKTQLDLDGLGFNTPTDYVITVSDGSSCTCELSFNGRQDEGTYILNYCSFNYGSGNTELNCNALNQTGIYTKDKDTLTIKSSGSPDETYH